MKDDLSERLKMCISIEVLIGEIYREFVQMFPGARNLWEELALEEENHALILAIGSRYEKLGKLPNFVVPDSLSRMKDTLELVESTREKIQNGNISITDALEMSLMLEQTLAESYLLDVMTSETGSEVVSRLQKLITDTKSHIVKVSEYMKKREEES